MIPLIEEPKENYQGFKVYEKCYFGCGKNTKFWHWKTNQPICKECAKKHKVSEVEKSHPNYKCKSMSEYAKIS